MQPIRVWAPLPKNVKLRAGLQTCEMASRPDGWWTGPILKPGDRYGFIVDGVGPFPDPRSACQPDGVHGLSQVVDQEQYRWRDQGFRPTPLSEAIIYELHIGTFTADGTFLSAIDKLSHLVELGVTHVELMPVVEFSGSRGWGYDGVDLFAPHHVYGSPNDLKTLVDACHLRGLSVILDVVYNHLGPAGNYLSKFGPYFTRKFATFWGEGINFDGPCSGEVRRFFCDNALMWLRDFHFDGLRLDAVHGIVDLSATHILEQLKEEVAQLSAHTGRELILIPESDLNDPRLLWPRERGGCGLDAQWSDDFHHALHAVLTGECDGYYSDFGGLENLAAALRRAFVYDGRYSAHRKRSHGRPIGDLSGHRFLAYLQNHDQVGNRAQGDRSSRLMSAGKLKIGAALVLTSAFVPMIFQGEEWGASTPFLYFTDYQEPELAKSVHEGRCREFAAFNWRSEDVPHPQARETFDASKLNWGELAQPAHSELLVWHRRLMALRKSCPELSDGRLDLVDVRFDESRQWLVIDRQQIVVVCNLASGRQRIPLRLSSHRTLLISQGSATLGEGSVELDPEAVAVLQTAT